MKATIELPKAFSVRDDRELPLIQDLVARLNPKLLVVQVATGMSLKGGYTVNWGLVYLEGQPVTDKDVQAALEEAGLDFKCRRRPGIGPVWRPEVSQQRAYREVGEGRWEGSQGTEMPRRWQRSLAAACTESR